MKGDISYNKPQKSSFKNRVGFRNERVEIIEFSHVELGENSRRNTTYWKAKCDCGTLFTIRGEIPCSCGCKQREIAKETGRKNFTTHGLYSHPLYKVYASMKQRCYDKNCSAYHNYGGRGITVCDEWKNDFKAFYDWCISSGWKQGLTIERNDVNGNYEPSNCSWATMKEQGRNKRNNKLNIGRVIVIKNLFKKTNWSASKIASIYDVHITLIYDVLKDKIWT